MQPHKLYLHKNIQHIKDDFPIFKQKMNGYPLVYLDTAASAQKPACVIEAMANAYQSTYANIHRGVYKLAQQSTEAYEAVRLKVCTLLKTQNPDEIVFTKNATEAFNLLAQSWGGTNLKAGDEIILTEHEHHANIVPWQLLQQRIGFKIKVIPIQEDGNLDLAVFKSLLSPQTKLLSITHQSNALGIINPIKDMIKLAKDHNLTVIVDGCQAIKHLDINVPELGCDFYVFTGHKLYGPTGVGVLWGKYGLLEAMPPYQGGGDMIQRVSFDGTTYRAPPARFEAGTPPFVSVIGLGTAIDYFLSFDKSERIEHDQELTDYATKALSEIEGLRIYGSANNKLGVISFTLDNVHPHDVATFLDQKGIALRAGHHCAQPLMKRLNVSSTLRASFGLYTTQSDIDCLAEALQQAQEFFK